LLPHDAPGFMLRAPGFRVSLEARPGRERFS